MSQVKVGKTVDVESLNLMPKGSQGIAYKALYERLNTLKEGKAIVLDLPRGVSAKTFQNRLGSFLRRKPPQMLKGLTYIKRSILDKNTKKATGVAVIAVKDIGTVRHGGAKPKASRKKGNPVPRKHSRRKTAIRKKIRRLRSISDNIKRQIRKGANSGGNSTAARKARAAITPLPNL